MVVINKTQLIFSSTIITTEHYWSESRESPDTSQKKEKEKKSEHLSK